MYTMSGVTVSEGISQGRAFVIVPDTREETLDVVATFSASEESLKYRKASRDFANKLNNAASGTVPDRVRDLFGAVASYITNSNNIKDIDGLIFDGRTALDAANEILIPKIIRFTQPAEDAVRQHEEEHGTSLSGVTDDSSLDKAAQKQRARDDYEDDWEMQLGAREIKSLMRDFISTIAAPKEQAVDMPDLPEPAVVIARDLSPAEFLSLRTDMVRAVILEAGEASGHLGTVLRDLGIPAVYGVKGAMTIKSGELVLVDANRGSILIEPPKDTASAIIAQQDRFAEEDDGSTDNLSVTVAGSMGAVGDIARLAQHFNHGLGLLRSEFLFLNFHHEPTVEEMVTAFKSVFDRIPADAPLTARTFDFAGDKRPLFTLDMDVTGPLRKYGAQVGSRLLKNELRAMLLASAGREINIVFPLITRISEARSLNELLSQARAELRSEKRDIGRCKVGLMIETPAAVLSARGFASYGDMFMIGTSSLAEYAAAPRPPEEYFTPALSKMIAIACKAANAEGVKVGLAGRFAMRTELMPFFLSLGVSYITTDSASIIRIRKEIQRLLDKGLKPHYDPELFDRIMDLASARDLQILFNEKLTL